MLRILSKPSPQKSTIIPRLQEGLYTEKREVIHKIRRVYPQLSEVILIFIFLKQVFALVNKMIEVTDPLFFFTLFKTKRF